MIIYDFEVFKYNWMVTYIDTDTRKLHTIYDDRESFIEMYEKYKSEIWIGYNSRQYDVWIAKAILAGFNPYEMSDWLINKGRKGFEFSRLLNNFQIINYDSIVGFRGLKELEAFMGHDIRETTVPFNIDRRLSPYEIEEVKKYNIHDVMETFEVFVEMKEEFESHIGLILEFNLPKTYVSKTKAQLSAEILNAIPSNRDDEFDIRFPDTLQLGKYEYVKEFMQNWGDNIQDYSEVTLKTEIAGVPTIVANGGLHGAINNYIGDGHYILADVSSYYPALMIEYDFLSRNVSNPDKYTQIRDERLIMKSNRDPREYPRKIVLNSTFGAKKDKYNKLYDPLQANNICFAGQLLLIDLIEKLEGKVQMIQYNTDGVLFKLFQESDKESIINICEEWAKRTRMSLGYDEISKVIQKDVNNYIIVEKNGRVTSKGAWVKRLSPLDNDLPIVNKAVKDYFISGTPVEYTIGNADKLIDFQKITKISSKYEFGFHEILDGNDEFNDSKGIKLSEKVLRCFASKLSSDGTLYKKHKDKDTLDKTGGTPEKCFIDNSHILDKGVPNKLDRQWYIDLANRRIREFVGEK